MPFDYREIRLQEGGHWMAGHGIIFTHKNSSEHWVGARTLDSRPTSAVNLLFDLEKALYFWPSDLASVSPDVEWKWGRGGRRQVHLDLMFWISASQTPTQLNSVVFNLKLASLSSNNMQETSFHQFEYEQNLVIGLRRLNLVSWGLTPFSWGATVLLSCLGNGGCPLEHFSFLSVKWSVPCGV